MRVASKVGLVLVAALLLGAATEDAELRAFRGKVAFDAVPFPSLRGKQAADYLKSRLSPQTRKTESDGMWIVYFHAVFSRASFKGPVTIFAYDKNDPESLKAREPVYLWSLENPEASWGYRSMVTLDPDAGFNKGHTYLIRVGQILNKKETVYAEGDLTLE